MPDRSSALIRRCAPLVLIAALAIALVGCDSARNATPSATLTPTEALQPPRVLESYRYTLTIDASGRVLDQSQAPPGLGLEDADLTVDIEGWWVSPGRERSRATFNFGVLGATRDTIRIDGRVWTSVEGGAWRERESLTGPEDVVGQDIPLSPETIFGQPEDRLLKVMATGLAERPHTIEDVHGRSARHWDFDQAWFETNGAEFMPILATMSQERGLIVEIDLWGDVETGVVTKIVVDGHFPDGPEQFQLVMEMFDLNDPQIVIEEPAGAIGP